MINLSYCRWQNSSAALRECVNDVEEGAVSDMPSFEALDRYEQAGVLEAVRAAADLLELLPLGVLAKAGVDLDHLPSQDDIRRDRVKAMAA